MSSITESLLFSDDIDDRLAIAYLEEDFTNIWHGSWEELIASYHTMLKEFRSFRKTQFELIEDWYSSFRRTEHFRKLMENDKVRATIIDMADYEDPRKAAYNIAYYPRIAYEGDTAFERLIKALYKEYKAVKQI